MKRHILSLTLGAALALAPLSAMAADSQPQPDLAPGPAAGVQTAQGFVLGTAGYVALGVAAIAIVAVAASGNGGGHSSTTSTHSGP